MEHVFSIICSVSVCIVVIIGSISALSVQYFTQKLNKSVRNKRIRKNRVYVTVYALTNSVDSDIRLGIVHPFQWVLLNRDKKIYILTTEDRSSTTCGIGSCNFIKLERPRDYDTTLITVSSVKTICFQFSLDTLFWYFAKKPNENVDITEALIESTNSSEISGKATMDLNVLHVVNVLLKMRYFIVSPK